MTWSTVLPLTVLIVAMTFLLLFTIFAIIDKYFRAKALYKLGEQDGWSIARLRNREERAKAYAESKLF